MINNQKRDELLLTIIACIAIWPPTVRDHFFAASYLKMIPGPVYILIPLIPLIPYIFEGLSKGIRIVIDNYNNNKAAKSYWKEKEAKEAISMHFEDKYYQETQHEISNNDSDNEEKILESLGI